MPSLSITCSNYSIEFTQQKLKTVWECSQQGLKYTYSNDIYIPPLEYRCMYLLFRREYK